MDEKTACSLQVQTLNFPKKCQPKNSFEGWGEHDFLSIPSESSVHAKSVKTTPSIRGGQKLEILRAYSKKAALHIRLKKLYPIRMHKAQ